MITVENFTNKEVNFYFEGQNLHFKLSQSLFSSFDIDQGSKLLLKTIIKSLNLSKVKTVLDIGCGIGVLGITLKSFNPHIRVFSQDRDALAVEFTRLNAESNRIKDIYSFGSLAMEFPPESTKPLSQGAIPPNRFDLLVSNLPAKAGEPVLRHIIKNAPYHSTPDGTCAFVIVEPLKQLFKEELIKNDFEILTEHSTKKHSVFIYRDRKNGHFTQPINPNPLIPYLRSTLEIDGKLTIETVYGIKNFDSLDFETELVLSLLHDSPLTGDTLIWNPYQGYIPVYLATNRKNKLNSITIVSRDYLSLSITEYNMKKTNYPRSKLRYIHHPFFDQQFYKSCNFNSAIVSLDHDPGIDYSKEILKITEDPSFENTSLIISGKSHQIAPLKKLVKKKNILKFKKNRGYSGIFIWFTH